MHPHRAKEFRFVNSIDFATRLEREYQWMTIPLDESSGPTMPVEKRDSVQVKKFHRFFSEPQPQKFDSEPPKPQKFVSEPSKPQKFEAEATEQQQVRCNNVPETQQQQVKKRRPRPRANKAKQREARHEEQQLTTLNE